MKRLDIGGTISAPCSQRRYESGEFSPNAYSNWQWHLDEVFVKINGETHYLWRAVDHEGEVLEVFAPKRRDRNSALKFLKRAMERHGYRLMARQHINLTASIAIDNQSQLKAMIEVWRST